MRKFGCFFIQFQHRLFFGHLYALVSPCFIAYPRKKNKHLFFLSWQYCLSKEKLSTGHFFFVQSLPPFIPPERAVFFIVEKGLFTLRVLANFNNGFAFSYGFLTEFKCPSLILITGDNIIGIFYNPFISV